MPTKFFFVFLSLQLCITLAQHHSDPWGHGGGSSFPKIRNSGPSKIFEWIGSRFSKLPSLLPRLPTFPKYESPPMHKLPNYHIMMPEVPISQINHHGDTDEYYSISGGPPQDDHAGGEEEQFVHEHVNSPEEHQNPPPPPPTLPPRNPPPPPPPPQYNEIPQQSPPLDKYKESPIDIFPSKLVMYEKETYPPQGEAGSGWQDAVQIPPPQNYSPPPPSSHQTYTSPQKENYAPPPAPPSYQISQQNYAPPPAPPSYQISQQNYAPPVDNSQESKPPKKVPFTPHSTGPDYFNTAYYHQENKFQTDQRLSIDAQAPTYPTFGEAYSSIAPAITGVNDIDLPTLFNTAINSPFAQPSNPYVHFDYPAQPTSIVPTYKAAVDPTGSKYISLSPGVKVLQSEDSGNPAFEVIADHNAPTFNGHPFDLNKLISMIEPGAQLVEAPRPSHDASPAGSEQVPITTSAKGSVTSSHSGSTDSAETKTGSSDFYYSGESPTNSSILKPGLVDLDITPSPPIDLDITPSSPIDLDNSTPSNFNDLMTFFQQTNGKGYIVVEKKGPSDPVDLETKNELKDTDVEETDDTTTLNVTVDNFKYLFDTRRETFLTTTSPNTNSSSTYFHPNHNYNTVDLDVADSNPGVVSALPPMTVRIQNGRQNVTSSPNVVLSQSVSATVSSSKMRPAPVYKKKLKITSKP